MGGFNGPEALACAAGDGGEGYAVDLGGVEDGVVAEEGDFLGVAVGVLVVGLKEGPIDDGDAFAALLDAAAVVGGLLEGEEVWEFVPDDGKEEEVDTAVAVAGGVVLGRDGELVPRSAPWADALIEKTDDALGDDVEDRCIHDGDTAFVIESLFSPA